MMIVHEKADGADMEPIAEVATAAGVGVRALLEKAAAGEIMLHVALRPFTYTVATVHGERHPSFQGGSATVQRWQLLRQYAAALSNFREAMVSRVPFPAVENDPADTFYFVLSEPQTVTVEHVFVARGHVVCDAPPSATTTVAHESVEQRQDRRLLRLRALGADMEWRVESWKTCGRRGALSELVQEEKLAGRPYHDDKDVRTDLQAAAKRDAEAKREGASPSSWCPM